MAELTTLSPTANWLSRIEASRAELIEVAKTGNRIASAFAMAEARIALIESLDDPQIKARLLRMTDPRIGMVELANSPTEEDRIRVCAIAILSGFCPGDDQFAVFGGKGGGKLYTKEAGFRTLFAHLGIVPEITTGHPEFVALGTSGKKVWQVGGEASCEYQGKSYAVKFAGAGRLGLPGYESDNVAGITAKARRQILKALWAKVSPILNTDQADDGPDEVVQSESAPQAIEQAPARDIAADNAHDAAVLEASHRKGVLDRLQKILKGSPDKLALIETVFQAILDASDMKQLTEAGEALAAQKAEFSNQVLSLIRPVYESRLAEMKGGAA